MMPPIVRAPVSPLVWRAGAARRAWRPSVAAAEPATFGTPTATSKFETGVVLQPAGHRRRADRPGRAAADVRRCDRPEHHRGPEHAGRRVGHADLHARHLRPAPPDPEHADHGALAASSRPTDPARGSSARSCTSSTPTTGSTGRPCPGDLVRVHWYEGDDDVRRQGAQARRGRGPRHVEAARRDRDRARRLLRLRRQRQLLRRARAGRPRERRGRRPSPNIRTLLGLIPPDQIDDPQVAVRIPHEFVHMVFDTASSRTRTTARRAGSTRAWPSTRARATARPTGAPIEDAAKIRHAHPARRPDRPVPERQGLLPRLLGERRRRSTT